MTGEKKKLSPRIVFAILCFVIAAGASVYAFYNYQIYRTAAQHTEDVMESIVFTEPSSVEIVSDKTEEDVPKITYPSIEINYDRLMKINPDFVGVLYIPALDLSYPVAHSKDNIEYLTVMFDGTENSSGAIFLSCDNSSDLSDYNSIIYGHNMRNGTMFGSLKRFRQEEGLCASDPYLYIYTKDAVLKYHIFAYYLANQPDVCYGDVADEDLYDQYIAQALKRNEYDIQSDPYQDDFSVYPNLVTVSTCSGRGHRHFTVANAAFVGIGNTPQ